MDASPQDRSLRILRTAVLVLAIFLIAAVVVWVVGEDEDGEGGGGQPAEPGAARILDVGELSDAAAAVETPIYWAGERAGAELELSEPGSGRAYVRYLTDGAEAGDPRPAFLAIGTYRLPGAFAALRANARRTGVELRRAARGFRVWVDPRSPTSVYLARPGEDFQVEVYDPDPETALDVALSPDLRPAGGG
jgi:hypothetical protein